LVVVRAFANTEAVTRILGESGVHEPKTKMTRFIQGFNQIKFCDFVSVGSGKDRADEKIKALFERACTDPTCVHMVFGACHDNGYVRMLEQVHEPEVLRRITLLKSFQTGYEFKTLPFACMEVNGPFRTQHIRNAVPPPLDQTQASHATARYSNGNELPEPATYASIATGGSQAILGGVRPPDSINFNRLGRRLDQDLPTCDPEARGSYHKKLQSGKRYCKSHFLAGQCSFSPCSYEHMGLSAEEIKACRVDMREKPCKTGVHCKNLLCFYGHCCPRVDCTGQSAG